MKPSRNIKVLKSLLDKQATRLRNGDLAGAFAIAPAIEKLLVRLEGADTPDPSVQHLKEAALRNGELIKAAKRGVETARRAIESVTQRKSFLSYDARGRATRIGQDG